MEFLLLLSVLILPKLPSGGTELLINSKKNHRFQRDENWNWFPTGRDCSHYSVDVLKQKHEMVWTIANFQRYYDYTSRFQQHTTLSRQFVHTHSASPKSTSRAIIIDATMSAMPSLPNSNDSDPYVVSTLQIKYPWKIPDVEFDVNLEISTSLGKIESPSHPDRTRWVESSFVFGDKEFFSFEWKLNTTNSTDFAKITRLGYYYPASLKDEMEPEITLIFTITQFLKMDPNISVGQCPKLMGTTKPKRT